jgi:hypothetical protein
MEETGVILNFFKELNREGADRRSIIRALFLYILERSPSQTEIMMLYKLIKDFGYSIVFEALVTSRYNNINFESNYWGYIITVCRNLVKESVTEDNDDTLKRHTNELLSRLRTRKE